MASRIVLKGLVCPAAVLWVTLGVESGPAAVLQAACLGEAHKPQQQVTPLTMWHSAFCPLQGQENIESSGQGVLMSISRPARREQLQNCARPALKLAHAISSITVFRLACCPHPVLPALLGSRPSLQLLQSPHSALL